jgi:hypothetical protein
MAAFFRGPSYRERQGYATKVLNSVRGAYPAAERFLAQQDDKRLIHAPLAPVFATYQFIDIAAIERTEARLPA